jgi:phage terminase Nu1 subunit (DNA packaging protein)
MAALSPCSCGCGAQGPKGLTLAQAVAALGQSERTLRRWVADGCPHHKGAGRTGALTFERSEVEGWMRETQRSGNVGARTGVERALGDAAAAARAPPAPAGEKAGDAVKKAARDLDEDEAARLFLAALEGDDRAQLLRLAPNASPMLVKKIEAVAKARVALADAVKRELDNQQRRRELLVAVDVAAQAVQAVDVVSSGLDALPGKLTPRLVGQEYDAIYGALEDEIRALREAFSDAFSRLG